MFYEELHLYKLNLGQDLTEDCPKNRLMMKLEKKEITLGIILFFDERTFALNGKVNR